MAYRMSKNEREIWNLHASGMTLDEVSSVTGFEKNKIRCEIAMLWKRDRIHGGLEGDVNKHQLRMMNKPSIETECCPFCGKPASNRHHIVPRSQGGTNGPTITVCGIGNMSGCHKLLHDHKLHIRFTTRWEYLRTEEPTRFDEALMMTGWKEIRC